MSLWSELCPGPHGESLRRCSSRPVGWEEWHLLHILCTIDGFGISILGVFGASTLSALVLIIKSRCLCVCVWLPSSTAETPLGLNPCPPGHSRSYSPSTQSHSHNHTAGCRQTAHMYTCTHVHSQLYTLTIYISALLLLSFSLLFNHSFF